MQYFVITTLDCIHQITVQIDKIDIYCQTTSIRHTKSKNLNVSHLVLQLSLPNPLKPGGKLRMKIQLEQCLQAMLQLHLNDQQFYCLLSSAFLILEFNGTNFSKAFIAFILWFFKITPKSLHRLTGDIVMDGSNRKLNLELFMGWIFPMAKGFWFVLQIQTSNELNQRPVNNLH